ncbi:hypothetical protein NUSPORA_00601 [Nucleospora cyclopteri]
MREILEKHETNEEKEKIVIQTVEELIDKNEYINLLNMLTQLQENWKGLSTARLTKIIKKAFEMIKIDFNNYEGILLLINGLIEWSGDRKLIKLDFECKLVFVYLTVGMYKECQDKIKEIVPELKKFEDKINLITLFIYESRAYYELRNTNMAKSSLTAARAMAVSAACPLDLQAQIDLLNGMYLTDEKCYDTAVGYFVEAAEGFVMAKKPEEGILPLRYIILCKILNKKLEEIEPIFKTKYASKILVEKDELISILQNLAEIVKKKSIVLYKNLMAENARVLEKDLFINKHLNFYYNSLLDQNILKIIEPYSHVKISFIARQLGFDENLIEDKLRVMILDKSILGILDHKTQCLVLYDEVEEVESDLAKTVKILSEFLTKIK